MPSLLRYLVLIPLLALGLPTGQLKAQEKPKLIWGGDRDSGGAPFIYFDADKKLVGFETELADYLVGELGMIAEFQQVRWEDLPEALNTKKIQIALNGKEYSAKITDEGIPSLPYFSFSLRLVVPRSKTNRDGKPHIRSWDDLIVPEGEPKKRVVVLTGSLAQDYMQERYGDRIELLASNDVTGMFAKVSSGEVDATVQDSPAARYFILDKRWPELKVVDKGVSHGLYVIVARADDQGKQLIEKINVALTKGLKSGKLKEIYKKYGMWTVEQQRLLYFHENWPPEEEDIDIPEEEEDRYDYKRITIWSIWDKFLHATWLTIALACVSMPIAIMLGIILALVREFGPRFLQYLCSGYIEMMRGTPIILQMFVWFYLVPQVVQQLGWEPLITLTHVPYFVYGVFGLSLNYAACEAENYRAGIQAIPKGQMEAGLALGMTQNTVIRRIILPQAFRIVIPPVTNDFIALLKDTSVCSLILITELTGLYYQYKFHREIALELALTVAILYLSLSYPLALLSRRLERKLQPGSNDK